MTGFHVGTPAGSGLEAGQEGHHVGLFRCAAFPAQHVLQLRRNHLSTLAVSVKAFGLNAGASGSIVLPVLACLPGPVGTVPWQEAQDHSPPCLAVKKPYAGGVASLALATWFQRWSCSAALVSAACASGNGQPGAQQQDGGQQSGWILAVSPFAGQLSVSDGVILRRCALTQAEGAVQLRFNFHGRQFRIPGTVLRPVHESHHAPSRQLSLFAFAAALSPLAAQADGDHDQARAALEAGEILPLPAILERVARVHPGSVLEVELERRRERWIYRIKIAGVDGTCCGWRSTRDGAILKRKDGATDAHLAGRRRTHAGCAAAPGVGRCWLCRGPCRQRSRCLVHGRVQPYDAIVLDLGLPVPRRADLLRRWRSEQMMAPVLILTARDQWHEKVTGIDAGADDYLTKPFHAEELFARVRALIRRASGQASSVLQCGPILLDTRSARVSVDGCRSA